MHRGHVDDASGALAQHEPRTSLRKHQSRGEVYVDGLDNIARAHYRQNTFRCDAGILARPERVVIIVAGLLLESIGIRSGNWTPLTVALLILAVGTNFTAVQRVWEVWQQNREELRALRGATTPAPRPHPAATPQPVRAAMRRFFENLGKT